MLSKLDEKQTTWDAHNINTKAYLRLHPKRATKVHMSAAFNAARLLRVSSSLPYLTITSVNYPKQKWISEAIVASC